MHKTHLSWRLPSGDIYEVASLLQAKGRCWLAEAQRRHFRARALDCKSLVMSVTWRAMRTVRSNVFKAMTRCATHRLAALRAQEAAGRGYEAALLTVKHASEALEVANVGYTELLRAEAGARWITEYVTGRVAMSIPTHVRNLLARGWYNLEHQERPDLILALPGLKQCLSSFALGNVTASTS